jgi:hypothetical protein
MLSAINTAVGGARLARRVANYARGRAERSDASVCHGVTKFMISMTLVAGTSTLEINDATIGSETMADLGDLYRYYAFDFIEFEFPAPDWTTAVLLCAMYIPSNESGPSTFLEMESQHMACISAAQTVSTKLRIPKKALHGQLPWFLTKEHGTDPNLATQGRLRLHSSVSSAEDIVIKCTVGYKFKDLVDPTTFAERLAKTEERIEKPLGSGACKCIESSCDKVHLRDFVPL